MIKQRGSSWWVVVYAGRDPLTGKKVQKTGTAPTKKAAKQLEAKLVREAGRTLGNKKASGSHTVGELLDAWHEWRPRKGGISERQLMNYRSIIDNKLAPALGKTKLSAVDTAVIDRLLSQLSLRGKRCQHCHHLLRTGQEPLRDGVMYRPRPGLREREHKGDCVVGQPLSASAVRDVYAV